MISCCCWPTSSFHLLYGFHKYFSLHVFHFWVQIFSILFDWRFNRRRVISSLNPSWLRDVHPCEWYIHVNALFHLSPAYVFNISADVAQLGCLAVFPKFQWRKVSPLFSLFRGLIIVTSFPNYWFLCNLHIIAYHAQLPLAEKYWESTNV
jgi:hypothetical protein